MPHPFALEGGEGSEGAGYCRLKDEINAVEQTVMLKDCEEAVAVAQQYREREQLAKLASDNKTAERQHADY